MRKSIAKDKSVVDIKNEYEPDSVSPPWGTILDTLADKGIAIHELARAMGVEDVTGLLSGEWPIDEVWAERLERSLDIPASFWLNRQKRYDESKGMAEEVLIEKEETESYSRVAWLIGEIDSEPCKVVMEKILEYLRLDREQPIMLMIDSHGGYVENGLCLAEFIQTCGVPVDTYAIGMIYSAAVPVFLAGKRKFAYASASFMVHPTCGGNATGTPLHILESYAVHVKETTNRYHNFVLRNSNIPGEVMERAKHERVYFDAKQALKWGVCDEVLGKE